MTSDSQPEPAPGDELRWQTLLRASDVDVPPPDMALLAALRERSGEMFVESSSASSSAESANAPADQGASLVVPASSIRSRTMFNLAMRVSAAVLAVALMVMFWLRPWTEQQALGGVPLAEVLDKLRDAQTLQLRVSQADRTADVWIRRPGLVRWQESPTQYQIAAGSRLWQIDETANTVSTSDSPWFVSAEQPIDLLKLLTVNTRDRQPLLSALPVARETFDGRECFVYRVQVAAAQGAVQIEAYADVATLKLAAIIARDPKLPRDAAPPLAELQLVAVDPPVKDEQFVVATTLTEDGRIGQVSDAQGVVTVRPMLAKRWTPICRELLVRPGDWLRTDIRGANALKVTLSSQAEITLGPGSLLECISPTQARLHAGMAQVKINKQATVGFELLAPRAGQRQWKAGEQQIVRVDRDEKLVDVAKAPLWLAGFEGTSRNESLGSLLVNLPDGRNEPLSVGYHKVQVEIRDQIARTTIEESFVNHTDSRLEGIFHFPLPQDASISGFGMWIGNDLVEADIVEKQRAREIYETILREKRDPGLLEWAGGNLFKARIFPIEARSEKRIKIVYTQVLPLRAGQYRYTYSLRSELLRTKPLRELSLAVTVNSALPLKNITCPTHSARLQQTAHSGQVEFTAQEYTPTRDFEVVCEVDGKQQSDVVLIPHRRGEDGYLLLQITPPSPAGNWQRELLPEGTPLNLVLLCDTSASMDSEKRRQQSEFVASVLSALGENDRFNLLAADVGTVLAFKESVAPSAENIEKAQAFLHERVSLGWTNLERAFDDVLKKTPDKATVIYVGDGIVTAGESDPASFAQRLRRMVADAKPGRSFHAVTVGNTFESTVLKGIAAVGGGSVRNISGEQTPPAIALELLNEIAQPALKDLNVEFRGLKVAAVYPGRLPNLAAGTQQIIVGRYLPEGKDQQGEVIVTGQRGNETVRYSAKVTLKDAEEGNSFIPRLWARAHLDQLLQQGQSRLVRDDILRLSEEFHIITPYTSLLVLETDADRERFGVKRRYLMRDGERFFAQGNANAQYELLQQQMKLAGTWRLGLRRQALRELAGLGRNARMFEQQSGRWGKGVGRKDAVDELSLGELPGLGVEDHFLRFQSNVDALSSDIGESSGKEYFSVSDVSKLLISDAREADKGGEWFGEDTPISQVRLEGAKAESAYDMEYAERDLKQVSDPYSAAGEEGWAYPSEPQLAAKAKYDYGGLRGAFGPVVSKPQMPYGGGLPGGFGGGGWYASPPYQSRGYDYTTWLQTLFPVVTPAASPAKPAPVPEKWSPEALALAKSLLRRDSLAKLEGGVEIERVWDTFNPRWQRRESHNAERVLYSPKSWLTRSLDAEDHTLVEFANAQVRGMYSLALGLGRTRASVASDLSTPPFSLLDLSLSPIYESHYLNAARVEAAGENQAKLILTTENSTFEWHFTIDTAKHVLLKQESFEEGKRTGLTSFQEFVEVGGTWWATKVITTDAKDRKIAEIQYKIVGHATEKYAQRLTAEMVSKAEVQFLKLPLPKLATARQKVADGSANFDDRIVMLLHTCQLQQWDEALKQVEAAEKVAAEKPGVRWLRTLILSTMRRNEEARVRLLTEARQLAEKGRQDDWYLAEFILSQANGLSGTAEFLELNNTLKPVYERQPAELRAMAHWTERLRSCYESLGRSEEALKLSAELAMQAPWDVSQQVRHAQRLSQAGQPTAAIDWLKKELARPVEFDRSEDETLNNGIADLYREQFRWQDLVAYTTAWVAKNPEYGSAYAQHLTALVMNDQLDKAYELVAAWLKQCQIPGKLSNAEQVKMETALAFAQGNGRYLSFARSDPRWYEPLAEYAKFFVLHPHHGDFASRVYDYRFWESDVADRLRGHYLQLLEKEQDKLAVAQLNYLVGVALNGRIQLVTPINDRQQLLATEVPNSVWQGIAAQLQARWQKETRKYEKHLLGESLRTIYAARFADTELLPLLRARLDGAPVEFRTQYRQSLLETLLTRPWTEAIEQEAYAQMRDLSAEDSAAARLLAQLPMVYRLTDAMVANRQAASEQKLKDAGGLDKLTRQELAAKKAEFLKTARAGVAKRLGAEAAKQPGPLADWLTMEQAWLQVKLGEELEQVEARLWKLLGDKPVAPVELADADELQIKTQVLAAMLRQRALVTLEYLATRPKANDATIQRVLKYLDAGIALGGDNAAPWRSAKFGLLVALDKPDDLEKNLRTWIRDDANTAPWRQALARLLAERGQIEEAIGLFEAAEKQQLLTSADYKSLSDWYLIRDQRAAHDKAKLAVFMQMPEHQLANMAYSARYIWRRTDRPLPSELDENTLLAFRALFAKSANPEQYLWQLNEVYTACRDFRLLQMLPDALLGRSPEQIYAFLKQLQLRVLGELRNEATADEIIARIKQLRAGERTTTDSRALDLFEAMVERRSSEVLNQPGPHVDAALAALQRAFNRELKPGEPRQMASLLYELGTLRDAKLQAEQLRQLQALREREPASSRDRLWITHYLTHAMFWYYHQNDAALQIMENEANSYLQANKDIWPQVDSEVLDGYIRLYEGANRHAAGEVVLQKQLAKPESSQQTEWLQDRLLALYNHALSNQSEVSLGKGETLFENIVAHALRLIDAAPNENVRYNLLNRLVNAFDVGHSLKLAPVAKRVEEFAFTRMPLLLAKQQSQYRNTAAAPVNVVATVLGSRAALRYMIERMEQYPSRLEISWDNAWNAFCYELGRKRQDLEDAKQTLGDLEPRLLKLVIKELQRDMTNQEARNQYLYNNDYSYFWKAKNEEFAKAANEVYAAGPDSGRRAMYIAQFFWNGLDNHPRAIEILFATHNRGVLDLEGQDRLVDYLHLDQRYAESIPLLEAIIKARPDEIRHRTQLMLAYFKSSRPEQLRELLTQTDAHFHQGGRWQAGTIAELGRGCLACDLREPAIKYLQEGISLYQREHGLAGRGDAQLSQWYQYLATAFSGEGKTKEGVDAASAAVVCWGPNQRERADAINALQLVLSQAKDLAAYVEQLNAETAKTGQDSPLLRKTIAKVYQQRNEHALAAAQYEAAIALQPTDKESYQGLIACYDALGKPELATKQLLAWIDFDRHDLTLYQQLVKRYEKNEAEAERAATSLIEAAPLEAENHAALAELRQQQNRWDEALPHWQQVADLRRLEPTGLVKLAKAQVHLQQWQPARQTLAKLRATQWPDRFAELPREMSELEASLPKP